MTYHIIGGGLAGMTVAWETSRRLLRRQPDDRPSIILYDCDARLGGKAGSDRVTETLDDGGHPIRELPLEQPTWSDHGYHLFPSWYREVIELMGEIGVSYDSIVVEGERFTTAARAPMITKDLPDPPVSQRIRQGVGKIVPGYEFQADMVPSESRYVVPKNSKGSMAAVFVTAVDLLATRDRRLEARSMKEFLEWRYPLLKKAALPTYETLLLKALSARPDKMASLAVAKLFRRWTSPFKRLWSPSWSSLDGSLQLKFIDPFRNALERRGVDIRCNHTLVNVGFEGDTPTKLEFEEIPDPVPVDPEDKVVFAVPPAALASVTREHSQLHSAAEKLADMSSQFAGVDIYFATLQATPRQHFGFRRGVWTTAYNITPVWSENELAIENATAPTVLQLVVPEVEEGTDGALIDRVKCELGDVFDFDRAEWVVHRNADSPLSLANKGVYSAREEIPEMPNVFISGDFMDSSIGVPCMEGAVGNGRRTAARMFHEEVGDFDPDVSVALWVKALAITVRAIFWVIQSPYFLVRFILRPFRHATQPDATAPTD